MTREVRAHPEDPLLEQYWRGRHLGPTGSVVGWDIRAVEAAYAYSDAHAPWWHRLERASVYRAHHWLEAYGPRACVRRMRARHERARRGWARSDVWSLDSYLSGVLAGTLRELADHLHGYPDAMGTVDEPEPDLTTPQSSQVMVLEGSAAHERWRAVLIEMAEGFEAWLHRNDTPGLAELPPPTPASASYDRQLSDWAKRCRAREDEAQRKLEHSLTLLARWFPHLWD